MSTLKISYNHNPNIKSFSQSQDTKNTTNKDFNSNKYNEYPFNGKYILKVNKATACYENGFKE